MSDQQIQTLKGFRDFLGEEAKKRQWLIDNVKKVFERFGYEPLETPALEYESLLLGKYGAEADKLIFGFEDRGGRRVALRYDQTVPTARIIAQYQNQLVLPFKRYQIQPVWRSDKPQKGRFREFYQCDIDTIGTNSPLADAETLMAFAAIFQQIGLDSMKIKINDRSLLINTIKNTGIKEDKIFTVIQTIDKLDKKSKEEVIAELVEKGINDEQSKNLLTTLEQLSLPGNLAEIIVYAQLLGIPKDIFIFSPTLARGLDYYTGMIFEGIIPEYEGGSIGGGGRYDNLIKQLVGVDMPAVGFALGFDRTLEAAEAMGKVPKFTGNVTVLVTIFSPELTEKSLEVTKQLREQGIAAECFLDPNKKLDAQLKYANKKGIRYVIILGPEEVEKGTVKLKNMQTGEQKEIGSLNEFSAHHLHLVEQKHLR